jgi:hypothetical protein
LNALYTEAEERQKEQNLSLAEINQTSLPPIYNSNLYYQPSSTSFKPPIAQVIPIITHEVQQNLCEDPLPPQERRVESANGTPSYKRQKISEGADFTNQAISLPKSKQSSPTIEIEEDQVEVQLINELSSGSSTKNSKIINFAGFKTLSEGISTNYAKELKDKEIEIQRLELIEETKIIDSQLDEMSLKIQKSIYKDSTPLLYQKGIDSEIRCFCGSKYSQDQTKLIRCRH